MSFDVYYKKQSVIVTHNQPRIKTTVAFSIFDGREKPRLKRLKDNIRHNGIKDFERIYYLSKKYEIEPISIKTPKDLQHRHNTARIKY